MNNQYRPQSGVAAPGQKPINNLVKEAPQNVEYEYYKRIKLIGEGSYGKAYLVQGRSDNKHWVIKQISLESMSPEEQKESIKEARILQNLNHPNIVKFKEIYKTKAGKLCIVMEYADGGDLSDKIKHARGHNFREEQILDWFTQICLALKHVHDRKILHRDLKGGNIFLTAQNICKMGDFGIARVLSKTFEKAKSMVGTPYYLSPEIINNTPYSFKSDVWSLGVILYELCALKPPFSGVSLNNLALNIVKGEYAPIPRQYSPDLRNLVTNLLSSKPESRYSVQQILALPYIRNRIKNFLSETIKRNEFSHTILHNQRIIIDEDIDNLKKVAGPPPPSQQLNYMQQQQLEEQQNRRRVSEQYDQRRAAEQQQQQQQQQEQQRMQQQQQQRRGVESAQNQRRIQEQQQQQQQEQQRKEQELYEKKKQQQQQQLQQQQQEQRRAAELQEQRRQQEIQEQRKQQELRNFEEKRAIIQQEQRRLEERYQQRKQAELEQKQKQADPNQFNYHPPQVDNRQPSSKNPPVNPWKPQSQDSSKSQQSQQSRPSTAASSQGQYEQIDRKVNNNQAGNRVNQPQIGEQRKVQPTQMVRQNSREGGIGSNPKEGGRPSIQIPGVKTPSSSKPSLNSEQQQQPKGLERVASKQIISKQSPSHAEQVGRIVQDKRVMAPSNKPQLPIPSLAQRPSEKRILSAQNQQARSDQPPISSNNRPQSGVQRPQTAAGPFHPTHAQQQQQQQQRPIVNNVKPLENQQNRVVSRSPLYKNEEAAQRRREHLMKIKIQEDEKKKQLEDLKRAKIQARIKSEKEREQQRKQMKQDLELKRSIKPIKSTQNQQHEIESEVIVAPVADIKIEWMGSIKPSVPPERPKHIEKQYEKERIHAHQFNAEAAAAKRRQEEQRRLAEQKDQFDDYDQQDNQLKPLQDQDFFEMQQMMKEMKSVLEGNEQTVESIEQMGTGFQQDIDYEREDFEESCGTGFASDQQSKKEQPSDLLKTDAGIKKLKQDFTNIFGYAEFEKLYKAIYYELQKNERLEKMDAQEQIKTIRRILPTVNVPLLQTRINLLISLVAKEIS